MDELGSIWKYQSHENVDHIQQKLVCTTMALEAVKKEANEELKKYKEYIKHLGGLLKVAYQERDEARKQLQKVLDNLVPCPTRVNSSITESNNSYGSGSGPGSGSPPVDSFVSSPDSTAIVRHQPYSVGSKELDVIDNLCQGLVLPQKGGLLKAVVDSAPVLNSLLVSGPLPQWKNPPPLQPLKIPPLPINGSSSSNLNLLQMNFNGCSSTASMMSFGAGLSRGYPNDDRVLTNANTGLIVYDPVAKKQRFQ